MYVSTYFTVVLKTSILHRRMYQGNHFCYPPLTICHTRNRNRALPSLPLNASRYLWTSPEYMVEFWNILEIAWNLFTVKIKIPKMIIWIVVFELNIKLRSIFFIFRALIFRTLLAFNDINTSGANDLLTKSQSTKQLSLSIYESKKPYHWRVSWIRTKYWRAIRYLWFVDV